MEKDLKEISQLVTNMDSEPGFLTIIYISNFGRKVSERMIRCHNHRTYQNDEHFKSTKINIIYIDRIEDLSERENDIIDQSCLVIVVSENEIIEGVDIEKPEDGFIVGIFAESSVELGNRNESSKIVVSNDEETFVALRLIVDNLVRSTTVAIFLEDVERILNKGILQLVIKKFPKSIIEKERYLPFKKNLMGVYGGNNLTIEKAYGIVDQLFNYDSQDSLFLHNVFGPEDDFGEDIIAVIIGSYEIDDYLASLEGAVS